jgi:hypothetical protein
MNVNDILDMMSQRNKSSKESATRDKTASDLSRLTRLILASRVDSLPWKEHLCRYDVCNPETVTKYLIAPVCGGGGSNDKRGSNGRQREDYTSRDYPSFRNPRGNYDPRSNLLDPNKVYCCRHGQLHVCDGDSDYNSVLDLGDGCKLRPCVINRSSRGTLVCVVSGREIGADTRCDKGYDDAYASSEKSGGGVDAYVMKGNQDKNMDNNNNSNKKGPSPSSIRTRKPNLRKPEDALKHKWGVNKSSKQRRKQNKKFARGVALPPALPEVTTTTTTTTVTTVTTTRASSSEDVVGYPPSRYKIVSGENKTTPRSIDKDDKGVVTTVNEPIRDQTGKFDYFTKVTENHTGYRLGSFHSQLNDMDSYRAECSHIIHTLYYSPLRTYVFEKHVAKKKADAKKALVNYYQSKYERGEIPILVKAFMIYYTTLDGIFEKAPALPVNEKFVNFAQEVVMLQWAVSCLSPYGVENPRKLNFTSHCLAVLNFMKKEGKMWHNRYVIPGSAYASRYAPKQADLKQYGYEKKSITEGTRALICVYNSIVRESLNIPYKMLNSYTTYEEEEEEDSRDT